MESVKPRSGGRKSSVFLPRAVAHFLNQIRNDNAAAHLRIKPCGDLALELLHYAASQSYVGNIKSQPRAVHQLHRKLLVIAHGMSGFVQFGFDRFDPLGIIGGIDKVQVAVGLPISPALSCEEHRTSKNVA